MRRSLLVLAGTLSSIALAACGSTAVTAPEAAAPAVDPAGTAQPVATPAASAPTFGFVHAVDASMFPTVVLVDEAEWFTGDEAVAAARADGHDVGDDGLEHGSYIRNDRQDVSELTTVGNVVITIVEPDGSERNVTPQEWEERIRSQANGEGAFYEPYHLTVVDGEIVEVRSQPVPLA